MTTRVRMAEAEGEESAGESHKVGTVMRIRRRLAPKRGLSFKRAKVPERSPPTKAQDGVFSSAARGSSRPAQSRAAGTSFKRTGAPDTRRSHATTAQDGLFGSTRRAKPTDGRVRQSLKTFANVVPGLARDDKIVASAFPDKADPVKREAPFTPKHVPSFSSQTRAGSDVSAVSDGDGKSTGADRPRQSPSPARRRMSFLPRADSFSSLAGAIRAKVRGTAAPEKDGKDFSKIVLESVTPEVVPTPTNEEEEEEATVVEDHTKLFGDAADDDDDRSFVSPNYTPPDDEELELGSEFGGDDGDIDTDNDEAAGSDNDNEGREITEEEQRRIDEEVDDETKAVLQLLHGTKLDHHKRVLMCKQRRNRNKKKVAANKVKIQLRSNPTDEPATTGEDARVEEVLKLLGNRAAVAAPKPDATTGEDARVEEVLKLLGNRAAVAAPKADDAVSQKHLPPTSFVSTDYDEGDQSEPESAFEELEELEDREDRKDRKQEDEDARVEDILRRLQRGSVPPPPPPPPPSRPERRRDTNLSGNVLELSTIDSRVQSRGSQITARYRQRQQEGPKRTPSKSSFNPKVSQTARMLATGLNQDLDQTTAMFGGTDAMLDYLEESEQDERAYDDPVKRSMKFAACRALIADLLEESKAYDADRIDCEVLAA